MFDEMIENNQMIEQEKNENTQPHNYAQDDFFDSLSTSINKNEFNDPYHSHKTTKQTFGYVPSQKRGFRGRGRGKGNFYKNKNNYQGNRNTYQKKSNNNEDDCQYVRKK